jgi:hypothetical protein
VQRHPSELQLFLTIAARQLRAAARTPSTFTSLACASLSMSRDSCRWSPARACATRWATAEPCSSRTLCLSLRSGGTICPCLSVKPCDAKRAAYLALQVTDGLRWWHFPWGCSGSSWVKADPGRRLRHPRVGLEANCDATVVPRPGMVYRRVRAFSRVLDCFRLPWQEWVAECPKRLVAWNANVDSW